MRTVLKNQYHFLKAEQKFVCDETHEGAPKRLKC